MYLLPSKKDSGFMNFATVYPANEGDKSLTSFHDAFSSLLGRRTNEPASVELLLGAEGKLFEPVPLSNQWSPIKAINPSQIFKPKRNTDANVVLPHIGERFIERKPIEQGPFPSRYSLDVRIENCNSEFQNADSDYFSANSSPRWDPCNPSSVAWDNRNLPRVENLYGNASRHFIGTAATGIPQPHVMPSFHVATHLKSHQEAFVPIGMNHLSIYPGKKEVAASPQWYIPLPSAARPISIRQRMPNIAAKTLVPVSAGYEFIGVPASLKYIPQLYRTEYAMPGPVFTANASVQTPIVSSLATTADEVNISACQQRPPFPNLAKKPSLAKERIRERAIRDKLNQLTAMLPYEVCKSARPLKSTILEKAAEYITTLKDDIALMKRKVNLKAEQRPIPKFTQLRFLNPQQAIPKQQELKQASLENTTLPTDLREKATLAEEAPRVYQSYVTSHASLSFDPLTNSNVRVSKSLENIDGNFELKPAPLMTSNIKQEECFDAEKCVDISVPAPESSLPLHNETAYARVLCDTEKTIANLKRPMNSFMLFSKEHRQRVVRENPGLDNRAISRKLGNEWCKLTPTEKIPYRQRFRMQLEILRLAFPNWTYNSYKRRECQAKRKYRKRSLSWSDDTNGRDINTAKKGKHDLTKAPPNLEGSKVPERKCQPNNEAKINKKSSGDPKSAIQWSSWLHGGPYFSCAFPSRKLPTSRG